jgi:hypothetical protein
MTKADDAGPSKRGNARDEAADRGAARAEKPVYEKPRLRRYDQIDQVKPYGPSEL